MLYFLIYLIRRGYEASLGQMDTGVSNSANSRRRTLRYLRRDSIVVHPPCDSKIKELIGLQDPEEA